MDLGKVGKVAKAVETAAPKLEDVAKDAMAWVTQADKRTKAHETHFSNIEDLRNDLADTEEVWRDYGNSETERHFKTLKKQYNKELTKMMDNLQPPQSVKDRMAEELDWLDSSHPDDAVFNIHNPLSYYHDRIAKLPPNEKKLFDTVVDQYTQIGYPKEITNLLSGFDYASGILPRLRKLNPTQQDTFLKMLPEWEQSLDDLEVVARTI